VILPNAHLFGAALRGVQLAARERASALRATCAGLPAIAAWHGAQALAWEGYIRAMADEALAEATVSVAGAADGQPDVPHPVTPAVLGVQSGTEPA
jgi:hypothetical protein